MCISPAARNDIFKGSTTCYDESIKSNNVLVGPQKVVLLLSICSFGILKKRSG